MPITQHAVHVAFAQSGIQLRPLPSSGGPGASDVAYLLTQIDGVSLRVAIYRSGSLATQIAKELVPTWKVHHTTWRQIGNVIVTANPANPVDRGLARPFPRPVQQAIARLPH